MRRIVVVGSPGSGKTTLARELADALGLVHIEFDHLHHRPGWTEASAEGFRADLVAAMAGAADTVVWLDLSRRTVMTRVVRRTVRRAATG